MESDRIAAWLCTQVLQVLEELQSHPGTPQGRHMSAAPYFLQKYGKGEEDSLSVRPKVGESTHFFW